MKFCTNCGTQLREEARFCHRCGTACVQKPVAEEQWIPSADPVGFDKPEKKPGRVLIPVLCLAIVLLAAGILVMLWYVSPAQKAIRAAKEGNFELVAELLKEKPSAAENETLCQLISGRAAELEAAYEEESMEYEEVQEELDVLVSMDVAALETSLGETEERIYSLYKERNFKTVTLLTMVETEYTNQRHTKEMRTYDEQGRLSEISYDNTYYSEYEERYVVYTYRYHYDEAGNITKLTVSGTEDNEPVEMELTATYEDGRLVSYVNQTEDIDLGFYFVNDEDGTVYLYVGNDESCLENEPMYSYRFYDDGYLYEMTTYLYGTCTVNRMDKEGRTVEYLVVDEDSDEFDVRITYEYNDLGRMTSQKFYQDGSDEPYETVERSYDDLGRITAMTTNYYGEVHEFEFEAEGNRRILFMEEMGGSCEYEYDDAGNVVYERMVSDDGEMEQIYRREYTELEVPKDYRIPNMNDPKYVKFE